MALVRQWMPSSPVQPIRRASSASARIRPAHGSGPVNCGSFSSQGIAHFGRPVMSP